MSLTLVENENGKLGERVRQIPNSSDWRNTLATGDFEDAGDIDYIGGIPIIIKTNNEE